MTGTTDARELGGRAAVGVVFAFGATLKGASIAAMLSRPVWSAGWALDVLAGVAGLGFILLIVATTLARLPPKRSARGIEPRVSALIGAFAMAAVVVLPRAEVADGLRAVADVLTLLGSSLCAWCLWWLGRSFSTTAQARRLVTGGPYRVARHPLYVCEAVVMAGILLRNPVWPTFAIAATGLAFQYRRMVNEERVLSATFPEYESYAARVPMLGMSPGMLRGRARRAA